MRVVVTGSFNGQDSLGDECLLKAVIERVRYQQPDAKIVVQLHESEAEFIRRLSNAQDLDVERGVQSVIWRTSHVLERLRIPSSIAGKVATRGVRFAGALDVFAARAAIESLRQSDAFFVYGGTQFSGGWFGLNAPAYFESAKIVSDSGGKVFFGPQQYGPLSSGDASRLRAALSTNVADWRTRNHLDVELLEPDPAVRSHREIYDEVYSATRLYPSRSPYAPEHILFNLRHTTFDEGNAMADERYQAFSQLVDKIIDHFNLPALFFGVSGSTFCDDDAAFGAVAKFATNGERLNNVGRVRDEEHLFDLASKALFTVSMSFHGCLLAGIAGSPFVPVTEGNYYDYKYVDFDKYTGGQGTPLISLSNCSPEYDLDRIVDFVGRFDQTQLVRAREAASRLADNFYADAIGVKA